MLSDGWIDRFVQLSGWRVHRAVVFALGVDIENFFDVEDALVRAEASVLPFATDFAAHADVNLFVRFFGDAEVVIFELISRICIPLAFDPPGFF